MQILSFSIYRYNPENNKPPHMEDYSLPISLCKGRMMLDALLAIKQHLDSSLSFRRSCGAGVCGSDGMSINGKNYLACITPYEQFLQDKIIIRPLPGMPVIRDLVVDLSNFYKQYHSISPFLQNSGSKLATENLQSPEERAKLDGLYECILCACCTSSCPSYWWNSEKFIGPAAAIQAARFIMDSRDDQTSSRLKDLNDPYRIFRCRSISNCHDVCPKGLNPTKAINQIKIKMLNDEI